MDVMPLSDVSDMHVSSHCEKPFSSDFCQEFIGAFVRCAAGVVAGIKPGASHLFGTDEFGRDILSRIIYGCQISLSVGVISQLIALFIGFTMGVLAGYYG